jgi:hypothetical protein
MIFVQYTVLDSGVDRANSGFSSIYDQHQPLTAADVLFFLAKKLLE